MTKRKQRRKCSNRTFKLKTIGRGSGKDKAKSRLVTGPGIDTVKLPKCKTVAKKKLDSDSKIRWRRCLIARGSRQRKERNRDRYRAKRIRNFGKKGATKTWKKTRSTRERRRWKRRG
jgi:hypothetical protein